MIMGDHAVLMTGYVRYGEYERGRKKQIRNKDAHPAS